jgi:hypothetical protein
VRAYDVALFVDRLLVDPAGTPNTGAQHRRPV